MAVFVSGFGRMNGAVCASGGLLCWVAAAVWNSAPPDLGKRHDCSAVGVIVLY